MEIYDFKRRYNNSLIRLKASKSNEHNKQKIIEFDNKYSILRNIKPARRYRYFNELQRISEMLNEKHFEDMTKDDYLKIKQALITKGLNNSTINTIIEIFKTFMRWLLDLDKNQSIPFMKGDRSLAEQEKVKPEDILTEKEVQALINATRSTKHQALLCILYYGSARIGEALNLKIEDIIPEKDNLLIKLDGKTGRRQIPLLREGIPYLKAYLQSLNREKGYLFIDDKKKTFQYRGFYKQLHVVGKRVGITKPLNPHNFRHSSLTMLSSQFKESYLRMWAGWSKSSKMPSVYIHLKNEDLKTEVDKIYGIHKEHGIKEQLRECLNCETLNTKTSLFCLSCGHCLNPTMLKEKEITDLRSLIMDCIKSEMKGV